MAAASSTSDDPSFDLGLNVWAKIDDYRPWPAYVIQKRRPTTQSTALVPVNFYGPDEEFSWIEPQNIMPITLDNFTEFIRDSTTERGFVQAVQQAYLEYTFPCPVKTCQASYHEPGRLKTHLQNVHDGHAARDRDLLERTRLRYLHECIEILSDARTQSFESSSYPVPDTDVPALSEPCSAVLLEQLTSWVPKGPPPPTSEEEPVDAGGEPEGAEEDEGGKAKAVDEAALQQMRPSFMSGRKVGKKTGSQSSDNPYANNKIRVGEGYQAVVGEFNPDQAIADAEEVAAEEARLRAEMVPGDASPPRLPEKGHCRPFGKEKLLWNPCEELDELEGLNFYLNFARTRGVRGVGGKRWPHSDVEHAHHVLHANYVAMRHEAEAEKAKQEEARVAKIRRPRARSGKRGPDIETPLLTRCVQDLSSGEHGFKEGPLLGYHYNNLAEWTPKEVAQFKSVYKEYGKNFQLIAQRIGSKTLAEVIEWYYQDFKDEPDYREIKNLVRARDIESYQRAQLEGVVTACDHCSSGATPRWRDGPGGEDWCDACWQYHQKNGRLPKISASKQRKHSASTAGVGKSAKKAKKEKTGSK